MLSIKNAQFSEGLLPPKYKQTPTGLRSSATEGYYNPDVFKVQHSVKIFHTISCSLK